MRSRPDHGLRKVADHSRRARPVLVVNGRRLIATVGGNQQPRFGEVRRALWAQCCPRSWSSARSSARTLARINRSWCVRAAARRLRRGRVAASPARGTGTSPSRCWPTPSWSAPAPRPPATAQGGRGRLTSQLGLLPLTVPEVLRLLVTLVWTSPIPPGFVLAWSRWRRRHQARARRAHHQRRNNTCGWSTNPPAFDTLTVDCSISGASVDEWAF